MVFDRGENIFAPAHDARYPAAAADRAGDVILVIRVSVERPF
jgi:hypothetical protein